MAYDFLQGRVAVVTGASRGIGAAIAKGLAQHGANVIVNYLRNRDAAHAIAAQINETSGRAIAAQADVGDEQAVDQMLSAVKKAFGSPDILVLNADSGEFRPAPFAELTFDAYERRLRSEMKLAITPTKAVLPDMIAANRGSIIAISSALCRTAVAGFSTLSVSKAALESFVRAIASEVGPFGVRANTVEASLTDTETNSAVSAQTFDHLIPSIPLRRIGKPQDIAGAVAFLASDLSGFINGATIPVNGGQLMY